MVPQTVRQGTVNPVSYNVIDMQQFTYKVIKVLYSKTRIIASPLIQGIITELIIR